MTHASPTATADVTSQLRMQFCLFAAAADIREQGFLVNVLTGDAESLARHSLALGYDGFEYMPNPLAIPDPDEFARALKTTGAALPVVNSGRMLHAGMTLFAENQGIRQRALAAMCRIVDFAGSVGADVGLGIARGPVRTDLSEVEMDQFAHDVFTQLAEWAAAAGCRILLEPAETEVTRFALTVSEVMAWVERVGHPAFSVMLDTHQLTVNETSVHDGVMAAQGAASHIHLFDRGRTPPGQLSEGHDWTAVFGELARSRPSWTASVALAREGDQQQAARRAVSFLKQHLNCA